MFGAQLVGSMGIMRIDLGWRLLAGLKEIRIHFSSWLAVSDASWKALKQHRVGAVKNVYICAHQCFEKLHLWVFFFSQCFPMGSTAQRCALPVTSKPSRASSCGRFGSGAISAAPLVLLGLLGALRLWCRVASFGKGGSSWGSRQAVLLARDVYELKGVFTLQEDVRTWNLGILKSSALEFLWRC